MAKAAQHSGRTKAAQLPGAEWVPIASLKPWDKNPRKNDGEPVRKVAESMRRFGFVAPIVVWRKGNRIVAGHTRLKALQSLIEADPEFVPKGAPGPGRAHVVFHDFKNAHEANLYALADNRLNELAEWDDDLVAEILEDYTEEEADLAGFDTDLTDGDDSGDDDVIPEVTKAPITKRGTLWALGDHRLLCGDAFDAAARARLFGGEAPAMVFTDPPYGMNLDTRFDTMFSNDPRHRATGERFRPVAGDDKPFEASPLFEALADIAEQFWWGADYYRSQLPKGGSWVVWDKRDNDSGMDLDAVVGSSFELCYSKTLHRREIARVLWSGHHGMQGEDKGTRLHPTQKPVALLAWFFERYGKAGDIVLDLFGGSGSTLIGCERANRRARVMELEPAYCDVIVERWERATGHKATRNKLAKAA